MAWYVTNMSGGVPNKIASAYEAFLGIFQQAAEDSDCLVTPATRPIRSSFFPEGDGSVFSFKTSLYLRKLVSRRLGADKRLDIAISALETLNKETWSITKSTVYVNYFVVSDEAVQLVQSLHFDFVQGGQERHPMFHLQLDTEPIPEADLRDIGVEVDHLVSALPENECWVTTRIPTPDMTLASVLYCVAADHLPEPIFAQFAVAGRKIEERLPTLEYKPLKESMREFPAHFKSSHWFAHMFVGSN